MELLQPPLLEAEEIRLDSDTTHFTYADTRVGAIAEALSGSPPERGPGEHANDNLGTLSRTLESLTLSGIAADQAEASYTQRRTTRRLTQLAHPFFVSLPFDEAERQWLVEAYQHSVEVYVENFEALGPFPPTPEEEATLESPIELLLHQSGTVVSAGLPKQVSGRDLAARWARWRNGEGEFADCNGPAVAESHLRSIARFIQNNKHTEAIASD